MKFSAAAFILPLVAGASAAAIQERQLGECTPYNNGTSAPFPHESNWGGYALCCNYFGPNPPLYTGCCDRNGEGTGSGFPGCVVIN
ncbi:hypothetical protein EsH8_VIII_000170 [Colletotrichum jinshuiense]